MNDERIDLVTDLHEAVLSADFSVQYADTVVEANQDLDREALEALIQRYRNHGKNVDKTAHLVETYNRVAAEGMAAFQEEAIDIVDEYLIEWARENGFEYEPPPNPYRRTT